MNLQFRACKFDIRFNQFKIKNFSQCLKMTQKPDSDLPQKIGWLGITIQLRED